MPYDKTNINERVAQSIDALVEKGFDGCITGSCVLANDFSEWETEPDVDFFGYNSDSWIYTVATLLAGDRYETATKKDEWKLSRIAEGRFRSKNKWLTQTIYIKDTETGIYINLSYKPGTSNITDVLSRFDTIAIMVGICCRTKKKLDLRHSFHPHDEQLPAEYDGAANPIRLWYMAEGWDEETWSRELARIKKYDMRGFDMTQMAGDMLDVAARVLGKGETIGSEKSKSRYLNLMLSCYRAVVWLEGFISPAKEEGYDILSEAISAEILKLIKDLPHEVQEGILSELATPLIPGGDKIFELEEEEGDEDEIPDDR